MEVLEFKGKKGRVVGIASEESFAAWVAKHFHEAGAELGTTYFNDKAKPFASTPFPPGRSKRARHPESCILTKFWMRWHENRRSVV